MRLQTAINLPSSKSLSNRALMIRAVSGQDFPLHDLSPADDTVMFLQALEATTREINTGPAGTTLRFLMALFALQQREVVLDGSPRMRQRPVSGLVDALRRLGADIRYTDAEGCLPVHIRPAPLHGGRITADAGVSSQFISALMMIGPSLPGGLEIQLAGELVSRPYVNMTAGLMETFGVPVEVAEEYIRVPQAQYMPVAYTVEKDWSAAAFWYQWLILAETGSQLLLRGLGASSLQGDAIAKFYYEMIGITSRPVPEGLLLTKENFFPPQRAEFNLADAPDLAPSFAAAMAGIGARVMLGGLQTLVNKETDRIAALQQELEKIGAVVRTGPDFLRIAGYTQPQTVLQFSTYHDHRMAMAMAPLVMRFGSITVNDPGVVSKSYPGYWENVKECCDLHFE